MVAKFLDDKPKNVTYKVTLHCFWLIDLIQVQLICQMLAKFAGVKSKGPYLSLEKEKKIVLRSPTL